MEFITIYLNDYTILLGYSQIITFNEIINLLKELILSRIDM